ncbi:MAG: penicillin acylase family protein [Sandaracinaceae bacterium]|nr:penicillin acylase family protein [Sandaracinaceae bacterium]
MENHEAYGPKKRKALLQRAHSLIFSPCLYEVQPSTESTFLRELGQKMLYNARVCVKALASGSWREWVIGSALLAFVLHACSTPKGGEADGGPSSEDGALDGGVDARPPDPPLPPPFDRLESRERFEIECLEAPAFIVRTEMNVPHIYAQSRLDAMCLLGFAMARDRFFQMDMTRRLALGRISELIGDRALNVDAESRLLGMRWMAERFFEGLNAEEAAEIDAFVAGINAYIEEVRAGRLRAPRELELGAAFLGARRPADLMAPWTRKDAIATGVSVLYGTSFDRSDVERSRGFREGEAIFPPGTPKRELRLLGLERDIVEHYAPPKRVSTTAGWGLEGGGRGGEGDPLQPTVPHLPKPLGQMGWMALRGARVEKGMLERVSLVLKGWEERWGRRGERGSNGWAVMGSATSDGSAILAGDGHLQLSVPPLFWQFGIDTVFLGGTRESTRLLGATIAGLPAMGVGTNGAIAWTQTAFYPDVVDWYADEIILDGGGLPIATRWEGAMQALQRVEEEVVVANVPALGSVGRTERFLRFVTWDGRWIVEFEGEAVASDAAPPRGQSKVRTLSGWVIPRDMDGDGRVSALSFYYGPFDGGTLLRAFRKFQFAQNVEEFRQAMRHFIAYGGAMMAIDREGSIVYSAYHAVPTREHLPRDPSTRRWLPGADPRRIIDGSRYRAWRIPLDGEGRVDEARAKMGAPHERAVPFDDWPQSLNPSRQYLVMANHDPAGIATDNDLFNDPYYIGGPWVEGYRGARIAERLEEAIAARRVTVEEMQSIQGDHRSSLGREWVPVLLDAIAQARRAASGPPSSGALARMAERWRRERTTYAEIERRMVAWRERGYRTPSGVETFYAPIRPGDVEDSVATSIFHAWFVKYIEAVLGDEGIPPAMSPAVSVETYLTQTMKLLEDGRGPGNPMNLGSYDPETKESVFYDDIRTPEIESSREMALVALDRALAFLRSPPNDRLRGGFGTEDMNEWRWGYRHMVRFDSLVGSALGAGSNPALDFLLRMFEITPRVLPLAPNLGADDLRSRLPHFPRPGDQFDVDAPNPGLDTDDWTYGNGPVFRMVIALGRSGVRGQNILPGGQSGYPGDPHFADQAALWLGNRTIPMRYLPEEVAEGATKAERHWPKR